MIKISIITPIYKTEKYLEKCLTSLVNQTLNEIELIWIDNGASDECRKIIEMYSTHRPSIKVIHLAENLGYGGAMNKGLDTASGEYIGFCDSDDWVDNDYYEKLYKAAKQTNSDIVYTNYKEESATYSNITSHRTPEHIITDTSKKIHALLNGAVWNKIFRRDILCANQIRFPTLKHSYMLDNAFLIPAVISAPQMHLVNAPYYHYIQHQKSTLHTTTPSSETNTKIMQVIQYILAQIDNKKISYQEKYELISFFSRSMKLAKVIKTDNRNSLNNIFNHDKEFTEILTKYKGAIKPSLLQKLFSIQHSFNKKIFWILGIKIQLKIKEAY